MTKNRTQHDTFYVSHRAFHCDDVNSDVIGDVIDDVSMTAENPAKLYF